MIEQVANKHFRCPLSIRYRLFKNKITPTPGLFCQCHDVFLDWLSDQVANDLITNNQVPVESWRDRKNRSKPFLLKKKRKPVNLLKERQIKRRKIQQAEQEYLETYGRPMPR